MVAPEAGDGGFAGAMLWCKGFRGSLASHRSHSSFGELCLTQESALMPVLPIRLPPVPPALPAEWCKLHSSFLWAG